ncbi:tripartite tricarboxylate transporter TctB family protein [Aidingimonas halophila]|uniref:Putative tricarboxylic transport membrane protein n=1 Tax=Aidingimonas halophila TaxID=574349 RepID=A0A1H3G726_9GAMM|nr:tripartite tricarboxylate transporter TctB family protein [Aidingimonas halophila]GHC32649.1 hypothetical protein GCM10008094_26690 [Aidingimonas halophila]SDX98857.1 putative tricarboxylic transport membrane protein [Aidingimonas halophila]
MKHAYGLGGKWVVPALMLTITTVYLIEAVKMTPPVKNGDITASFFPIVLAMIMYLSIAIVLWQNRRNAREESTPTEDTEAGPTTSTQRYGALWVTVFTGLYISVFSVIGYTVSTFVYVLSLTFLFGNREPGQGRSAWIVKIVAAAIITLFGYALFELIFQVRLPTLWT